MPDPRVPPRPFAGVRILDLAAPVSVYCARLLAAYGADVVRLESPSVELDAAAQPRRAWLDAWYAAGCRRVTLDVTDPSAVSLLGELAADVDVVIASPTASTPVAGFLDAERGFDWCAASVVTCLLTPFGATGPLRDWRATPMTAHAMSGLMFAIGPEAGPPLSMPGRQLWDEAGIRAAICIAAALRERSRVGGQVLDIAAHEVLAGQDDLIHRFSVAGLVMQRRANFAPPPSGTWEVANGTIDIAVNTPGHWEAFVKTMGSPPELTDEIWEDRAMRIQLHDVLGESVARLLRDRHRAELIAGGQANGLPCSALNTPEQFVEDQRVDERRPLGTLTGPDLGTCAAPGPPIHIGADFFEPDGVAVRPGADTETILALRERPLAAPRASAERPLAGLRVVTFGAFVAGNTAAMLLAELGMDVVKIESHERPEALRNNYFFDHPEVLEPSGVGTTALYGGLARSVRSVSIELAAPGGAEVLRRLVAAADVVVENFRPGVLDRFGCGFADLQTVNPRLTMLSISGYGRTGPRSGWAAYASNICNHVGLTSAWGHTHGYHFDYVAGYHGALGLLAALRRTEVTGRGVHLDLAQVEAGATVMMPILVDALALGETYTRRDNVVPDSVFSAVVGCDGPDRWLAVDAPDGASWERLCTVLGVPEVGVAEPGPADRDRARDALVPWAAQRTPFQAAHLLQHAGVAAAPVQDASDLFRDPQLRSRGFITELDHPDLGCIEYPGAIERTVRPSGGVKGPVPRLGEHTQEVLAEWAGIEPVEADQLAAAGAIWIPDR
ncbi:MAG: Crotonobetainyl-CoA:carnitine CoA-transferase CaiB [Ilumatobacteraceae bacterium]|nr:Crotonobetainyl-CoA:carnitine CoA-transferase CaiB [Ilumatobacteraceae bacterium]